jgi:hypothetical protein
MGGGSSSKVKTYQPQYAAPVEWYNPGLQGALGLGRGVVDAAVGTSPELRTADIPYLQEMAKREALINALSSMELEKTLSPETAKMRNVLPKQLSEDVSGEPDTRLSNMWLKQGLQDVLATGARLDSGFARSALADKTREDYFANRMALQDRVAAYLTANPMPVAGLDVGSLAGVISQTKADNANARDAYKQQVLGYLGSQAGNVTNAFNQAAQMESARRAQNASMYNQSAAMTAQARNAASAARSANQSGLMGAGLGAGGAIAGAAIVAL